jgi:hypothetical protein
MCGVQKCDPGRVGAAKELGIALRWADSALIFQEVFGAGES